ncbi:amino acid ABC transporter permease/ATP-binding protein [Rhodoferax lacus]|uniref:Amino acid ABC transporter permease/ATP-binding protein n=1 Tax=Rhodoferax lacus TaxID=2184758 RepID=A0A3E1RBA9_9BURK|nr:amino acid ABC transporter permease/ATP-binding protein [Rhodoferax lacus]RFO96638.1 amino acid ABC transporter permease/ATP-binding protein [Rhodoferax lacus]
MELNWTYFFSLFSMAMFWRAVVTVVELGTLSWLIGLVLGFCVASAQLSGITALRAAAKVYVWFFRSVPLLVLLVFVFNSPQIFPSAGPALSIPFVSGLLSLVLTETAYMAEIHRGGLMSVSKGQREAGRALGLGYWGIQARIVVPQAFRIALPTLVNEYVTVIKLTSLVSVISLPELLMTGQRLYSQNFLVMETLLAVAVYYVMIVSAFGAAFQWLERRLDLQRRQPASLDDKACGDLRATLRPVALVPPLPAVPGAPLALEMRGISKSYGSQKVLDIVQLRVATGEVLCLIGPSGSGKTSLIRTINALEAIDSGEIILFGESYLTAGESPDSERARDGVRRIGMVFQSFNLFPHLTVLDNVLMAPAYHGLGDAAMRDFALGLLDKVGLLAHAYKYPHQLSGGQQQRVAIARALAMKPDIMLFDEPTSALDPELVGDVLRVIQRLAKEGMTMLIVTHEMEFALNISDRVVFMEGGKLQMDVSPDVLRNQPYPNDTLLRVRKFMGMPSHGGRAA